MEIRILPAFVHCKTIDDIGHAADMVCMRPFYNPEVNNIALALKVLRREPGFRADFSREGLCRTVARIHPKHDPVVMNHVRERDINFEFFKLLQHGSPNGSHQVRPHEIIDFILVASHLLSDNCPVCVSPCADRRCDQNVEVIPQWRKRLVVYNNEWMRILAP